LIEFFRARSTFGGGLIGGLEDWRPGGKKNHSSTS